jgi:hypothetical protein
MTGQRERGEDGLVDLPVVERGGCGALDDRRDTRIPAELASVTSVAGRMEPSLARTS